MILGQVRITCAPQLSQNMIMPMIVEFKKRLPRIDISVHSSYSSGDLMRRTVDLALRFQNDPNEKLVGKRLPDFTDYANTSPDYIQDLWFKGNVANAN